MSGGKLFPLGQLRKSSNTFYILLLLVKCMAKTKTLVRKVFINKRNNQMSVPLSRKEIKLMDPTIKFSDKLFVELSFIKRRKDGLRK